jgi:hypothetical protein
LGWLALLAGLHQTYVSSVERGERNVTIVGIADKIARALGTTLSGMFSELDQEPDDLEDAWSAGHRHDRSASLRARALRFFAWFLISAEEADAKVPIRLFKFEPGFIQPVEFLHEVFGQVEVPYPQLRVQFLHGRVRREARRAPVLRHPLH